MKKNFLMMMAVLVMGSANAQEKKENAQLQEPQRPTKEQMLEQQSAQMANRLMLDETTAAKFAPIYRKYLEELMALNPAPQKDAGCQPGKCGGKGMKAKKGRPVSQGKPADAKAAPGGPAREARPEGPAPEPKQMTDAEIEAQMKARWAAERKTADIQEKYYTEFRKFLTVKQCQKAIQGGRHAGKRGGKGKGFGQRTPRGDKGASGFPSIEFNS